MAQEHDSATDARLLREFRAGDPGAFSSLVARHQGALLRHARLLTRDRGAAEDAVQEAFLTLARTPPELDPSSAGLGAWLHTVTRNHCLDVMRAETRRRDREDVARSERPSESFDPNLRAIDEGDTKGAIERSLVSLPDDQREVITLRLLQDKSYAEIAEITGRKIGTVGWLISVGMKALARELSGLLERPLEA